MTVISHREVGKQAETTVEAGLPVPIDYTKAYQLSRYTQEIKDGMTPAAFTYTPHKRMFHDAGCL